MNSAGTSPTAHRAIVDTENKIPDYAADSPPPLFFRVM